METNNIVLVDRSLDAETANKLKVDPDQLHNLKHSPDGKILLVPQPDSNPDNPLTWSNRRKMTILLAVSLAAVLPDYGSATGAVTLIPQGLLWNLTPEHVNRSQAGNVVMLGIGGIVACIFSNSYGRYPVAFWMILLSVVFAVLCAVAPDFETFFAARILNGFFSAPTQATGLLIVNDIYYFHEQVRKTNIWSGFFILSPYIGPFISALVLGAQPNNLQMWRWSFGEFSILSGVALLGLVIFADETWYNRAIPERFQPRRGNKLQRMTGIKRPGPNTAYTLAQSAARMFLIITKLPITLVCISFGATFMSVVGINTTLPVFLVPNYAFGPTQIGLFYLTPVVATLLGVAAGHYLNQAIQDISLRRRKGVWHPEDRLFMNWIALPFMVTGMILLGFALERQFHYMLVSLGWGCYVFSIMLQNTGYYQYALDMYPAASGEVSAWINMFRVLGGFILSYFMIPFVEGGGAIRAFSILAGLCAAAFIIVPILQVFGQRLRTISGDLPQALRQPKCTSQYVTPEQRPTNAELKAEEEFRE